MIAGPWCLKRLCRCPYCLSPGPPSSRCGDERPRSRTVLPARVPTMPRRWPRFRDAIDMSRVAQCTSGGQLRPRVSESHTVSSCVGCRCRSLIRRQRARERARGLGGTAGPPSTGFTLRGRGHPGGQPLWTPERTSGPAMVGRFGLCRCDGRHPRSVACDTLARCSSRSVPGGSGGWSGRRQPRHLVAECALPKVLDVQDHEPSP